jgi:hypothetical protein
MVAGYYSRAWSTSGRYNVTADYARGAKQGQGFVVGWNFDTGRGSGGLSDVGVGGMYLSNATAMMLMGGSDAWNWSSGGSGNTRETEHGWPFAANTMIGATSTAWGSTENLFRLAPELEELQITKFVKGGSRVLFGAQVALSGYQAVSAWVNSDHNWQTNGGNKWGVTAKSGLDITMAAIGTFGGPLGWAIAGVYFLGDVAGLWGHWGDAPKQ